MTLLDQHRTKVGADAEKQCSEWHKADNATATRNLSAFGLEQTNVDFGLGIGCRLVTELRNRALNLADEPIELRPRLRVK